MSLLDFPKLTRASVTLAMRDGSRPVVAGWQFESCGAVFVAHRAIHSGTGESLRKLWTITERTRGLSVGVQSDTRDAAIADWLARVARIGASEASAQLARAIAAASPL